MGLRLATYHATMDLYETTARTNRDLTDHASRLLTQYEAVGKYFLALALVVIAGFGLRMVFENQLGQVVGAMLVWFSLLFGVAGVAVIGVFLVQSKLAQLRYGSR